MGSLSPHVLREEGLRRRVLPGNPVLVTLCPHNQQPLCFPRSWQMLLCSSCAAKGIHRRCSYLRNSATTWQCDCCAGLGPGKRQSTRVSPALGPGARLGLVAGT